MATIYLVVPCYNEEEALPRSAAVLLDTLRDLQTRGLAGGDSRLLLVDDGSTDRTWALISELCRTDSAVCGLKLSRNRGHQNALMAGLVTAAKNADAAVSIDADLQDDPAAIAEMAERYRAGAQVVCGVRRSRASDSFFKRFTARAFYVLVRFGGAKVVYDHADFRLLSREAVRRLCRFGTEDLFLRGLVTRLGFPVEKVYYDRAPRLAGESKYSLRKMLHLARRGFESGKAGMAEEPQIGELYIEKELLQ
ncbi:MAG: glycosyltransferase family 2 protein [Oscillospiraceae bacterium]|nr:glycosyltransferase family 2 protein [Oscillospiraceae bacterium]